MVADDKVLVRRCLEGDTASFALLIDEYQRPLFNVALRMVNNYEDARDITQTAFVRAYEKLSTYDSKYRFFSWIYRILINESLNLLQRRKQREARDGAILDHGSISRPKTPEEVYEGNRWSDRIQTALMELSPDYRSVIVCKHFLSLSYKEMSQVLDIPEKTVKSRLFTARRLLCESLVKRGVART